MLLALTEGEGEVEEGDEDENSGGILRDMECSREDIGGVFENRKA